MYVNIWHENEEECKRARTPASSNNLLNFNSRHLTRKIYQKGGKEEKKTIKRNKYFRKIKGSNYTYDSDGLTPRTIHTESIDYGFMV